MLETGPGVNFKHLSPINPSLFAVICIPFATSLEILSETLSSPNEFWATGIQNLKVTRNKAL